VTLGNDNGTDGLTDRRTDRVRRIMRPPPREEGRIITYATHTRTSSSMSTPDQRRNQRLSLGESPCRAPLSSPPHHPHSSLPSLLPFPVPFRPSHPFPILPLPPSIRFPSHSSPPFPFSLVPLKREIIDCCR